jgi:hypothetical protein
MRLPKGGADAVDSLDSGQDWYTGLFPAGVQCGRGVRPGWRLGYVVSTKKGRIHSIWVRSLVLKAVKRRNWRVDNVHTRVFGSGRMLVGSGRIPHVSAGAQCSQGGEFSSSPTSGTTFSLVRGDFASTCVQSWWSRRSAGWCAGCGLAAAMAYSLVWVAGSGSWLVGPSACWDVIIRPLLYLFL